MMRVDNSLPKAGQEDLDRFELELRKLSGVAAVGFEGAGPDRPVAADEVLTVHLLINDPTLRAEVEQQAMDLGRLHHPRPLRIVVTGEGEEPGDGIASDAQEAEIPMITRVRLASVSVNSGVMEVTLSHGASKGMGRAGSGAPSGAATATLAALREMGWAVPFEVESAVRVALGITGAVLVHLVGRDGDRLGVSSGPNPEEAAVKATLQALNRWLDDPGRRPVTLRPMSDAPV